MMETIKYWYMQLNNTQISKRQSYINSLAE